MGWARKAHAVQAMGTQPGAAGCCSSCCRGRRSQKHEERHKWMRRPVERHRDGFRRGGVKKGQRAVGCSCSGGRLGHHSRNSHPSASNETAAAAVATAAHTHNTTTRPWLTAAANPLPTHNTSAEVQGGTECHRTPLSPDGWSVACGCSSTRLWMRRPVIGADAGAAPPAAGLPDTPWFMCTRTVCGAQTWWGGAVQLVAEEMAVQRRNCHHGTLRVFLS